MEHVRQNVFAVYQYKEFRRKFVYPIATVGLSYAISLGLYRCTCLPVESQGRPH
jgi:hypothetical protein